MTVDSLRYLLHDFDDIVWVTVVVDGERYLVTGVVTDDVGIQLKVKKTKVTKRKY